MKAAVKTETPKDDSSSKIKEWSTAIVNHLYWVPSSTPPNTAKWNDVVEAKWRSMLNHIVNKHKHEDPHYPRCEHPRPKKGEKKKKFIKKS